MIGCRSLTDSEINRLLNKITNPRDSMVFQLGLKTGFRISELLSIRIRDLYEHDGSLKCSITIVRSSMKGKHSSRSVPISKDTVATLKAYLDTLPASQTYLFESERGQLSRCQAWRGITTAAKAAGLNGKIATHSARKTLAMKAYRASGKDLALVQRILGHTSVSSTISYLSVDPENLSDVWKEIQK